MSFLIERFRGFLPKRAKDPQEVRQEGINAVIEQYETNLYELQQKRELNYYGLFQQLERDTQERDIPLKQVAYALVDKRVQAQKLPGHLREEEAVHGFEVIKARWQDFESHRAAGGDLQEWVNKGGLWEFSLRDSARHMGLVPEEFLKLTYAAFGNPTQIVSEQLSWHKS